MRLVFKTTRHAITNEFIEMMGNGPNGSKGRVLVGPTSFSYNIILGKDTHRGVHKIDRTDDKRGVISFRGNGGLGRAVVVIKKDMDIFEIHF